MLLQKPLAQESATSGAGSEAPRGRWYVVYTDLHAENMAVRHLANYGFQVFLPRRIGRIRHARRVTETKRAYFPRYLFVSLNLRADQWHRINSTVGVVRLLAAGERPIPVARGFVEAIEAATGEDGVFRPSELLKPGQKVKVSSGVFADQIGILEKVGESGVVRVLLSMMERQVSVNISRDDIIKCY